jgi:hypothetical protein
MRTPGESSLPERVSRGDGGRTLSDRAFGLLFTVFWIAVAIAPVRYGGSARVWAGILATAFLLFSVIRPTLLGPLNLQWQRLGRLLQKLTNPIVMAILFFSAVTPFGLIMRLLNRDVLRLKWDREAASYWIPRQPPGPPAESMKDQF